MLLVVGLGNPGSQYAQHRHNFGFMAVDAIARRYGFTAFRSKFQGELTEGMIGGSKVMLLKPQTYMNESGRSVAAAMKFYKLVPEDVLVLHDELDLAPGKLKVKRGGGLAGHNGLRDIKAHIGPEFRRVRLGIGHPGDKKRVEGYALQNFPKQDQAWVDDMLDAVADNFDLLVQDDDAGFMTRVAQAVKQPKKEQQSLDKKNGI
ncbi:MAG: aminoacyl-tRNA hydrolase [Rhodospirillales bacterium]|jgi:PTH1 family peptidyl-tRNA hydrolase